LTTTFSFACFSVKALSLWQFVKFDKIKNFWLFSLWYKFFLQRAQSRYFSNTPRMWIIMELIFVFVRKLLSKNKGTRVCDVPIISYKISQINACSFMHNQCLSKGLKKLKRNQAVKFKFNQAVKFKFQMQNCFFNCFLLGWSKALHS